MNSIATPAGCMLVERCSEAQKHDIAGVVAGEDVVGVAADVAAADVVAVVGVGTGDVEDDAVVVVAAGEDDVEDESRDYCMRLPCYTEARSRLEEDTTWLWMSDFLSEDILYSLSHTHSQAHTFMVVGNFFGKSRLRSWHA